MRMGLFMATQWPANADLDLEMANLCEQTRIAKDHGFSSVMVGQHFLSQPLQMIQAEPLISRLAAEGEGMTFGITILLLAMQNPIIVAENAASLDWITNGNYVLGVGLGYRREEFEALGVEFEQRVSRFEEAIPLIRRLWSEESVIHHGRHFNVSGMGASIKPKRAGGPPIWVGGDVIAAVQRAAKLNCPWIAPPTMTFHEIAERVDAYRKASAGISGNSVNEQPIIREVAIGSTKAEALRAARPALLSKYEAYASWGQTATKERVSLSDTFDDFIKDRFIIGDEFEVADEVARYKDSFGEGEFLVRIQWPGFAQSDVLESIERLGKIIT